MATQLKDILKKLTSSNSPLSRVFKNCDLLSLWSEIVGEKIAGHTEAIKIRGKILYVSVDGSAWAQELSYLKEEIMRKINAKAGETAIEEIRFKVK